MCIVRRVEKKRPEKTVSVTLDMPRQLVQKIEQEAAETRRTRSFVIRELLLRALAANEKTA